MSSREEATLVATIVTGLATPAGKISLTVPASVTARHTLHMPGTFALSDQPTPGPTQLIVQRENPDGSTSTLPEITTSNSGAFTVSDRPTQAGQTTWSVIYQSDAGHTRALETVTRTVVLPTPTLTLAAQRKTTPYATADVLTAHLSAHGSNARVALYAGQALVGKKPVSAGGVAAFTVKPAAMDRLSRRLCGRRVLRHGHVEDAHRRDLLAGQRGAEGRVRD